MNTNQFGFQRDLEIIDLVMKFGALDTNQIRSLLFPGKSGLRKAQARLARLYKRRNLDRIPRAINEPYVYFIPKKKPGNIEHLVMLNWFYIYLVKQFGAVSWHEEFDAWQQWGIRLDALAKIKEVYYGVEMDRSLNPLEGKIKKINELYVDHGKEVMQMLKHPPNFPRFYIVTLTPKRKERIEALIRDNNPHKIQFQVKLLNDVVRECMPA